MIKLTALITALVLLPSATQSHVYSYPQYLKAAILTAYDQGREDYMYEVDDIGLVRLSLDDVERTIK